MTINPTVGELVRAVQMPENAFNSEVGKLGGMNEASSSAELPSAASDEATVRRRVFEAANVIQVPSTEEGEGVVLKFSGQTLASKALVLVRIRLEGTTAKLDINCEKIVVGSMLAKELKAKLESAP